MQKTATSRFLRFPNFSLHIVKPMRHIQSRLSDYNRKEFLADIDGGFAKLTVLHIKA